MGTWLSLPQPPWRARRAFPAVRPAIRIALPGFHDEITALAPKSAAAAADRPSPHDGRGGKVCGGCPDRIALRPRRPAEHGQHPTTIAAPGPRPAPTPPRLPPAAGLGCAAAAGRRPGCRSRTGHRLRDPGPAPAPAGTLGRNGVATDGHNTRNKRCGGAWPGSPGGTSGKAHDPAGRPVRSHDGRSGQPLATFGRAAMACYAQHTAGPASRPTWAPYDRV